MKPEIDSALRAAAGTLLAEIAPAVGDAYARSHAEVLAVLLLAAAEEFDRAAEVRTIENRAMRRIFAEAAPFVADRALRERLESAAREEESSLLVSALNAVNGRLRALLIELHALVEAHDEEWARRTDRAIWEELRASANRRAISFFPL